MTSDVSVTPKERVNITYKAATGNAVEEQELPLKLMVIGDFKQRPDETPLNRRELANLNKDNFNGIMGGMNLSLAVTVRDRLTESPGDEEMPVQLKISEMRDFEPDRIVEQVPQLRQLMELRRALLSLRGPLGDVPAFRQAITKVLQDSGARERLLKELDLISGSAT